MAATRALSIAVVGVGPRGLAVLERLCANARHTPSVQGVRLHLVDPWPAGAGAVWRTDQSRELLMNTVASQITVFTDLTVTMDGPVEPGPSLYAWAEELRASGATGLGPQDAPTLAEAGSLGPDDYPTRAFFGAYLREMFRRVCRDAPPHVEITTHRSRAVALTGGTEEVPEQSIRLENGRLLRRLDAVVLSQGHVAAELGAEERALNARAHELGLHYVAPANPADVELGAVTPRDTVLLRGLGLNFFDYLALFTSGRGGTFTRRGGSLVYEPSGLEPLLCATSRRGIPYHARGENEKGAHGRYFPRLLTAERIAGLRQRAKDGDRIYFGTDLWPLISREVESVYYETLLARRGREADRAAFTELYLAAERPEHRGEVLDAFGIPQDSRWNWERLAHPCAGTAFTDREAFHTWLIAYLERDVRQARGGNVSDPVKAALDVLRDLRNEVRLAVDHGGLDGNSHRDELDGWYTPLNAFTSIGPPAFRIEQMIALIRAGVLQVTGPGATIRVDTRDPAFVCVSERIPAPPVRARVLIEARLPEPDLRRTADPLMRRLRDGGQATPFRIDGGCGVRYETGGMTVTPRPSRLVDAHGRPHPRRFAHGVPTESVHWVTAAAARPGVDSVSLGDADAIARTVLALGPAARQPESTRVEVAS
ncbi:FAD/NAD(P)-binding domain-containing protein [Streptomyces sp. JJ38]|uniref:FAD/NAD(P)-binding protein n=1 Tax=Streptomyces sp. JJ38 TaxID=2738128 RepID=UPI00214C6908|nr:FAD/NAD(P)-binding protein [Streptomyces sp. JJ38]